jgi:hypothetical protein
MSSKDIFPGFDKCIEWIRSTDPMIYENGYHLLLLEVHNYGDKIVELIKEEKKPRIKARFVELLGLCKDSKYIPVFEELLRDSGHDTVAWALTSLESLDRGKEIANKFRQANPKWLE